MATDPTTGLQTYGGSATTGGTAGPSTATPATTSTATPTTVGGAGSTSTIGQPASPTPSGPQDLGINVNPPTLPAQGEGFQTQLDPNIAGKVLQGGYMQPGTAAVAPRPYDEKELVAALASELHVSKGGNQEVKVIEALAKKHGVNVPRTTEGTGHKQGEIGGLRHDIASWFDDASNDVTKAGNAANAATNRAVGKPSDFGALPERNGQPKGSNSTVPDTSTKALQEMFDRVGKKLGIPKVDQNQKGFAQVAAKEGAPTTTAGTPGTNSGPQTAAQAWQSFTSNSIDASGKLTTTGQAWAADLVKAGALTTAQQTDAQAVAGAYASVLTQAANSNQTTAQVMAAGATQAATIGQPQNEWASYVQGVADEFGVALNPQQVNDIATQYYNQALQSGVTSVANGPSSMTDAIKASVVKLYDPNNNNDPAGVASQIYQGIKDAALQYGIPLDDKTLGTYVQTALQNATVESMYTAKQSAIDAYTTQFQQQAKGLYPTIAAQIDSGVTVANIMAPYNQLTAQYTGKDMAAIQNQQASGAVNPYDAFLQGGPKDPKTGQPSMMTMDQWKQKLMQDPQYGFQNTQGAKNMASGFASAILNEFGLVNTGSVGSSFPTSSTITGANS